MSEVPSTYRTAPSAVLPLVPRGGGNPSRADQNTWAGLRACPFHFWVTRHPWIRTSEPFLNVGGSLHLSDSAQRCPPARSSRRWEPLSRRPKHLGRSSGLPFSFLGDAPSLDPNFR